MKKKKILTFTGNLMFLVPLLYDFIVRESGKEIKELNWFKISELYGVQSWLIVLHVMQVWISDTAVLSKMRSSSK